jgi:hypothetical protein
MLNIEDTMDFFDLREEVRDICMSYGYDLNGFINFIRMRPEDAKTVRDFFELQAELLYDYEEEYEYV